MGTRHWSYPRVHAGWAFMNDKRRRFYERAYRAFSILIFLLLRKRCIGVRG